MRLPGGGEDDVGDFDEGFPRIAVGAGAVWAINPDSTVSRLDPASGRRVAVVRGPDEAGAIAAGDAGVWVISGVNTISRIDPRTNRMRKAIELGSNRLFGIAVGGGAVWATSEEGVLWRVEPGRAPDRAHDRGRRRRALRRVRRRRGVGGELERQHRLARRPGDQPGHRAGAGRRRPGARGRRRLGVGERRGRVPERGAAGERLRRVDRRGRAAGRADRLEPDAAGAERPSSRPRWSTRSASCSRTTGSGRASTRSATARATTRRRRAVAFEFRRCAANANAFAAADRLVAVIGPFYSFCAQIMIPILNRARGGPLALVGPTTTWPNLTRGGRVRAAGAVRLPRRARRLLPDRRTQLRAPGRQRRPAGRGARAACEIARAAERLSDQRR